MERHETRAARVAAVMREEVPRMVAPGAVWAIAEGPLDDRRVTIDAEGVDVDAIFQISSVTKLLGTACTLRLVDEGALDLDDPVERFVPEWAGRQVLRERHGELADTVPASRPTTVRDLLQMGFGLGYDMAGGDDPLSRASDEAGIMSAWQPPELDPDTWVERVASLPMRHQPGEGWLYQTSFDALAVVLERATGTRFDELLRQQVLDPLEMGDTGYVVPHAELHRVPALHFPDDEGGADLVRRAGDPANSQAPVFPSASTGLLSTVSDLALFAQALLDGEQDPEPAPLPEPAAAMAREFLEPGRRWGLGVGLDEAGRFGWDGGTGASLWVDRADGVAAVLLTHQGTGPTTPAHFRRFWDAVRR